MTYWLRRPQAVAPQLPLSTAILAIADSEASREQEIMKTIGTPKDFRMSRTAPMPELPSASRHVAEAKEIIMHQLDVVNDLGEAGHYEAAEAEHTLAVVIRTLSLLEQQELLLREEIGERAELRSA